MKYTNIDSEELEALQEVVFHRGYRVLEKIMKVISDDHDKRILGYNLDSLPAEKFIALKQRNEGIHWFIKELNEHRNKLMPKSLGGKSERRK